MKRDFELRDWILTVLEDADDPYLGQYEIFERVNKSTNNEYSEEQIIHHLLLASDMGQVKVKNGNIRLTNDGHNHIEEMRKPSRASLPPDQS